MVHGIPVGRWGRSAFVQLVHHTIRGRCNHNQRYARREQGIAVVQATAVVLLTMGSVTAVMALLDPVPRSRSCGTRYRGRAAVGTLSAVECSGVINNVATTMLSNVSCDKNRNHFRNDEGKRLVDGMLVFMHRKYSTYMLPNSTGSA